MHSSVHVYYNSGCEKCHTDISRLEGYQVTVERIAPSSDDGMKYEHKDCAMQAPMTYDIDRVRKVNHACTCS